MLQNKKLTPQAIGEREGEKTQTRSPKNETNDSKRNVSFHQTSWC